MRSQLKDVTEKVSPVVSNFMESKEVKGSINKFAQDITTILESFDISINIENSIKHSESNAGAGGSNRKTKPTPLQSTNVANEEESVAAGDSTNHQQAVLRPFIRTKSLSPMSGGGKDSNENDDNACVSSSARSTSNNSFFGGSDDQGSKMHKNGSIKNATNAVEDVPCLKPSRFKGGAFLQL